MAFSCLSAEAYRHIGATVGSTVQLVPADGPGTIGMGIFGRNFTPTIILNNSFRLLG